MHRQLLLSFALISCILAARADRSDYYDRPQTLQPGFTMADTIDAVVRKCEIHARVSADTWSLVWDYTDPLNFSAATIEIAGRDPYDNLYYPTAVIKTVTIKDGVTIHEYKTTATNCLDCSKDAFNSIKYAYDGVSARIFAGDREQTEICRLPQPPTGGLVAIDCPEGGKCRRFSAISETRPPLRYCRQFVCVDELNDYIACSEDPAEGIWEYLDRNIDTKQASLGGKYLLATIQDIDGDYKIIYLSGADINSKEWKPLMIKGALEPTIFKNNYDMTWTTADGTVLTDDLNATLSDDGAILTLEFPAQKSQIRLRRAIN